MDDQTKRYTYEVHLQSELVDELDIDSPVETERIDYYDSGLWVRREEGRDFFPYHYVLTIRERPAASGESATDAGPTDAETSGSEGS
jgi:hypothetical protein